MLGWVQYGTRFTVEGLMLGTASAAHLLCLEERREHGVGGRYRVHVRVGTGEYSLFMFSVK